jgi:hypothetical protein
VDDCESVATIMYLYKTALHKVSLKNRIAYADFIGGGVMDIREAKIGYDVYSSGQGIYGLPLKAIEFDFMAGMIVYNKMDINFPSILVKRDISLVGYKNALLNAQQMCKTKRRAQVTKSQNKFDEQKEKSELQRMRETAKILMQ